MKKIGSLVLVTAVVLGLVSCKGSVNPQSERQKTVYSLGFTLSNRLEGFDLKPEDVEYLVAGLEDGFKKAKPAVPVETYQTKIQEMSMARMKVDQDKMKSEAEPERKESAAFLEKAAAEAGITKLESGILIKMIKEGKGPSPAATDRVKVHYHGTLRDGTVFDSSVERGQPAVFPLNGVIPCWTEGVQKLKVGGKAKLYCPSEKAYGDRGAPPKIKGGAALTFEVELLGIESAPDMGMAAHPVPGGKAPPKAAAKPDSKTSKK